jgi:hypothetical protein
MGTAFGKTLCSRFYYLRCGSRLLAKDEKVTVITKNKTLSLEQKIKVMQSY